MKTFLYSMPFILSASAAMSHESGQLHAHLNEPNWLPLLTGLLIIAAAATLVRVGAISRVRK